MIDEAKDFRLRIIFDVYSAKLDAWFENEEYFLASKKLWEQVCNCDWRVRAISIVEPCPSK